MEALILAILFTVVALAFFAALLVSGRRRDVVLEEQTRDVLAERAAPTAPPGPGLPEAARPQTGVAPPQAVDLVDPALAAEAPPAAPPAAEAPPAPAIEQAPLSIQERFQLRLGRARAGLGGTIATIFRRGLDEQAWEELEESLIAADVGVEATLQLVEGLRVRVREEHVRTGEQALALLKEILRLELAVADRTLRRRADGPTVWLVTGVNGTGKTTSIGKLAARHTAAGGNVMLAAADTFRAAAAEQLQLWGERAGARVVRAGEGADPAAVAFDAYQAARADGADLLMVDTAGRLQNKVALMAELSKVKRVLEREAGPCDEVLLVLDATTGQNGLSQARAFLEAVDVSGAILTKLDGTAKGGIVIAIQRQLGIPVKLVGVGEAIDDLTEFDPDAFVEALFSQGAQDVEADTPDQSPVMPSRDGEG